MDLSLKERDRISVLRQVKEGVLSVAVGAARLGVTRRHFRRLRRKFEAEGDAAVVHGLRGRRSNRALPRAFRERALEVAKEPLYRDFGPTLLAEHLERSFALRVSLDTLRGWMMEAGLWKRQRRRAKHRSRRPRRAALGELEQWDSSVHAWLEDRAAGDQVLISIHDDATSRLMMARFVERDDGAENRRAIIGYLQRHGRPLAVYTDHAGHFGQWLAKKEERTDTIISRALGELGVEVILAGSPQAKGRVERTFGTAQDRLIKEMRVAGISTLDAANRFLADSWVPFWNKRFVVAPQSALDVHRPLPAGIDLEALFAETETRKVARDFIIRFKNRHWQIPEREAYGVRPGDEVVVERRLWGDIHFRIGQPYLAVESLGRARPPATPTKPQPAKPRKPGSKPPKPAPDHPWRKQNHASARMAMARRDQRLAEEAARSNGKLAEPPHAGLASGADGRGPRRKSDAGSV